MSNPDPSPANQFKPGNTASVGHGRPKGESVSAVLRELGDALDIDGVSLGGKTLNQVLGLQIAKRALGKDPRWMQILLNRKDGKMPDRIQVEEVRKAYDVENSPEAI